MKPEEIIYYNEMTKLAEPFTQQNIDDNKTNIDMVGITLSTKKIFEELKDTGEFLIRINKYAIFVIENIHWLGEFKFRIGITNKNITKGHFTENDYVPLAVCKIKMGKTQVSGYNGSCLSCLEKFYVVNGVEPLYPVIGKILLGLTAQYIDYKESLRP